MRILKCLAILAILAAYSCGTVNAQDQVVGVVNQQFGETGLAGISGYIAADSNTYDPMYIGYLNNQGEYGEFEIWSDQGSGDFIGLGYQSIPSDSPVLLMLSSGTVIGEMIVVDDPKRGDPVTPSNKPDPKNKPTRPTDVIPATDKDPNNRRGNNGEISGNDVLAQGGYKVLPNPKTAELPGHHIKDYPADANGNHGDADVLIEGQPFNWYTPATTTPSTTIGQNVDTKIGRQAKRIALNLDGFTDKQVGDIKKSIKTRHDGPAGSSNLPDVIEIIVVRGGTVAIWTPPFK
jgi:hypothetical protein